MDWNFNWGSKGSKKPGMVGIYETPTSLSAAYTIFQQEKMIVRAQLFEKSENAAVKQAALVKFVADNNLQGTACTYVLGAGEYSLSLVDVPQVPKEEIPRAIRWVLRDLINFSVDDAIIETFDLPYPRAKDNIKMIYAVAIRKELVQKIEALIAPSLLELTVIDIPELVLKNVVNRHPQEQRGCAFIQLNAKGGRLILCRSEQICITRSFELKLDELGSSTEQDNRILELLALEVQRSFDYINSVFRQSIPNIVLLAPTKVNKTVVGNFLKNNLGSEVFSLSIAEHVMFETPIKEEEESEYLLSVGAGLRGGSKSV